MYSCSLSIIIVVLLLTFQKESSAHGITVFGIANSAKSEQEAIQMLRESLQGKTYSLSMKTHYTLSTLYIALKKR